MEENPTNKVTKQEMKEAIKKSGYLIEQRVIPVFEKFVHLVETNDVYKDSDTSKTREIDLSCRRTNLIFEKSNHLFFTYLVCECENNKYPIVFFRNDSVKNLLNHYNIKVCGVPAYFCLNDGKEKLLVDFLEFAKFHHYIKGTFSTQYCTFSYVKKNKSWIATHGEQQHDTFLNLIKAVDYKIKKNYRKLPPKKGEKVNSSFIIFYPLLIVQGDLFEAYIENKKLILKEIKHIQYKKQNIATHDSETFQIDVIKEDYLKDFLKIIDKENNIIIEGFKDKRNLLEKSIENHINRLIREQAQLF